MQSINMAANAKINLALSVLGKRADGYHEIDTIFQTVDLCDRVNITKSDTVTVRCPGIASKENLATRAANLFFEKTGIAGGAHIEIEKHIPLSAGLGGGSADAAAVLTGLDALYGAGVRADDLSAMAVFLGADVPFFLEGGTARAKGIGEELNAIPAVTPWVYLLFKEGEKPSTAQMYRRLDSLPYPKPDIDTVERALCVGDADAFFAATDNSFSALWEKSETEEFLLRVGASRVLLSGSGPTRFAVFCDRTAAETAYGALREKGIVCFLTSPAEKTQK